jgi:hypothetical protein
LIVTEMTNYALRVANPRARRPIGRSGIGRPKGVLLCPLITIHLASPRSWNLPEDTRDADDGGRGDRCCGDIEDVDENLEEAGGGTLRIFHMSSEEQRRPLVRIMEESEADVETPPPRLAPASRLFVTSRDRKTSPLTAFESK